MRKLNKEKLEATLKNRLAHQLEACRVCGAHLLVLQDGQEVCSVLSGYQNWDTKEPLRPDAMYRLASMTKPVTGVAALIAEDKGYFSINDPVADYFPEFADMYVAKKENGRIIPGEKAEIPLRIRHLLTHTSGLLSETPLGLEITMTAPKAAYRSREAMIAFAAAQPLAFQPERCTAYTALVSFDMVAKLIEIKSGMSYPDFLNTYIFAPLGIQDLTYFPTEEQWDRMLMLTDRVGGVDAVTVDLGKHTFEAVPLTYSGAGAGLAGSMADYAKFAEMLRRGGTYNGVQIFSAERLRELTTPYVPPEIPGRDPFSSWGLGVRVVDREGVLPIGAYGWSGAYGTHFWIDPENRITAIYMRGSRWYDSHGGGNISTQFEQDIMAALEP